MEVPYAPEISESEGENIDNGLEPSSDTPILLVDTHCHLNLITNINTGISRQSIDEMVNKSIDDGFAPFKLHRMVVILHNPSMWNNISYANYNSELKIHGRKTTFKFNTEAELNKVLEELFNNDN